MSTDAQNRIGCTLPEEADNVRKNWGWLLAVGIVQIVAGMLAVFFTFTATLATVVTIGILLLVAAGTQLAAAVLARDWGGFFLFLLLGVLYAVAGVLMVQHPLLAAVGLTLMLAATFLVAGTFRIIISYVERFSSWGWVLCNGVITVLLGLAIWQQLPESGMWVLGLFVGIDLIVNGVTWSVLAVDVRRSLTLISGR
jgi:uncharacterized membrane protein HdeD (DUF308 family)